MANLYALLVGINDYPNVSKLNGCVADVQEVSEYLATQFKELNPQIKTLLDAEARRQNVIDQFRSHLGQAQEGDTVYFHFSGHGSRENAPQEFWQFFPEKKNETLVCYDSRLAGEGHYDLADKEVALLLAEIAEKKAHIVVCLDSCHSGSATRNTVKLGKKRQAEREGNSRPLSSYLNGYFEQALQEKGKIEIPVAPHINLSACRPSEVAWETLDKRGLFTSTLMEVLKSRKGKLTYADLFRETRLRIRRIGSQEPQFDLYGDVRAYDYFLTQTPSGEVAHYKIYFHQKSGEWQVDQGALQGLSTEYPEEIRFDLYAGEESNFIPAHRKGEAFVKEVRSNLSSLTIPQSTNLDPELSYTGIIANLPPPSLSLYTSLPEAEVESFLPIGLYEVLKEPLGAEYEVLKSDSVYEIRHAPSGKIISREANPDFIKESLRKIALWVNTRELENSKSKLKAEDLEVALYLLDAQGHRQLDEQGAPIRLIPEKENNTLSFSLGDPPVLNVDYELSNRSGRDLFVAALLISPLYGIFLLNKKRIPAGSTARMNRMIPNEQGVPVEGSRDMIGFWPGTENDSECQVQIKYLATTEEEIDTLPLEQADFSLNILAETRSLEKTSQKARFLGAMGAQNVQSEDWFTRDLFFRLTKSQQKIENTEQDLFDGQINIKAPRGFSADIQLGEALGATRSLKSKEAILGQFGGGEKGIESFSFHLGPASRSVSNQSLLELSNIQGELSEESPLELSLNSTLEEGECLIPLAFDGEDIIPIGFGQRDEEGKALIRIEEIPEEQVKSKSLGRALKFCLYKLASPITGMTSGNYYQLRAVTYTAEGEATYESDPQKIREQVASTSSGKILLLIHGIIGNTSDIVAFARELLEKGSYELILTFDYENLNTSIKEIAQHLKRRLIGDEQAVQDEKLPGVGIGPEQKIDILAHSMGGLVSRWMIEQLEGNAFVNSLVMCGTPNGGSVFGKIHEYRRLANLGLALACNGLLPLPSLLGIGAWATGLQKAKSVLGKGELITQTLGEMNKGKSKFLEELNIMGRDSGIPYYIIAANVQEFEKEGGGLFSRIYEKVLKKVGNLVSSQQANDVAVLVEDIKVEGKNQTVKAYDIVGHHLNYFVEEESVKLLHQIFSSDKG